MSLPYFNTKIGQTESSFKPICAYQIALDKQTAKYMRSCFCKNKNYLSMGKCTDFLSVIVFKIGQ